MTYITEIDTIAFQIDCSNDNIQREILTGLLNYTRRIFNHYIDPVPYDVGFDKRIEHKIYCNNRTIVSFKTGYTHNSYYISIKFAGLKSYDYIADKISSDYLFVIVAYLNSRQIIWKLSELDIAIDIVNVNFENILAVCTSKTSGTKYHTLGEVQLYDGETTWVEKFETPNANKSAIKRAYLYNKTIKERKQGNKLNFNLQRFEIKFQSGYFNKNGFNIEILASSLYMYHLMYFDNITEKNNLIDKYNSYQSVRKREIDRLGFEGFRLYPDIDYIEHFIYTILTVGTVYDFSTYTHSGLINTIARLNNSYAQ